MHLRKLSIEACLTARLSGSICKIVITLCYSPCLSALSSNFLASLKITSNMHSNTSSPARNFPAYARSRQASSETSLLRRDHVVIQASRSLFAVFVGTFGFALVTKTHQCWVFVYGTGNSWWANCGNSCRNAKCLCLLYVDSS